MRADRKDLIFANGAVFDGHRFLPAGTAVRVRDGRITAVNSLAPPRRATVVDLAGGTLLPGFIDAHVHPVSAGDQLRRCDLSAATSLPEYLTIIARYAAANPGDDWITGGGWSLDAFPGGVPTAAVLDDLVPGRPVFLPNRDGHGAWVNSAAMALAGIDTSTLDPADGRIERDASGKPIGMLQEGATDLVARLIPAATEDDWDRALRAGQARLLAVGITGWQDAIVGHLHGSRDNLRACLRAAQPGTLLANVVGALWWDRDRGLEQLPELLERRATAAEGRFRPTSVKMMLDGVAENHTAAMLEPYLDGHGCATEGSGLDFIDPAELPRFVTALDREGFQVHFHALGDRAVRLALDAVEAARRATGDGADSAGRDIASRESAGRESAGRDSAGRDSAGRDSAHRDRRPRHHLAHLQVVHPDDIPRFAPLRATANIQPLWAAHEPQMDELTIPFLGDRRASWQYPFRSLQAAGAALCAGSDWPVSSPNPLWGAHVAVNRSSPAALAPGGTEPFLPEQALDLTAVLAAYTSGSAHINGLEAVTGAIRAGLDADFALVDADLSQIASHEIGQAAVVQTWIRGELVYQGARQAQRWQQA
ncbi:MAG: amidohydrolase [Streptosporangiaceae bacterium]